MIKYKCKYCGETFEYNEKELWKHLKLYHPSVYDDFQDPKTPEMLELAYIKTEMFLVQIRLDEDDKNVYCSLMTEREVINRVDVWDCVEEEMEIYRISNFGKVERLKIRGTWHDPSDPLLIAIYDENDNVVFSGYGTDH